MLASLVGGILLYPYTHTQSKGIFAAAFFEQFCVQGAWSVIPIHLIELAPPAFRTFVVGTSYQTGVLLASYSNIVLVKFAKHYTVPDVTPETYDFQIPICVFAGIVFIYVILIAGAGPENRGKAMAEPDDESDVEFGLSQTRNEMTSGRF